MTTETIETQPGTCGTCRQSFDAAVCRNPFNPSKVLAVAKHCPACVEREKQRMQNAGAMREQERAEAEFSEAWGRICPKQYRAPLEGGTSSVEMLRANLPQFDEIMAHPLGAEGLILRGHTGAGKTRAMFRLLRSYFVRPERPRIIALTAGEFDRQARDAAGTFVLTEWFDRLARADVLFIDDVGKGKWTPATSGQFWELIDARTKHDRPVFMTTNFSGQRLVEVLQLDGDTAAPLLRRLRESCKVIVCQQSAKNPATPG